jgi:hypothetical protein
MVTVYRDYRRWTRVDHRDSAKVVGNVRILTRDDLKQWQNFFKFSYGQSTVARIMGSDYSYM